MDLLPYGGRIVKLIKYSTFIGNRMSGDKERAVLPTIIFARDTAGPASSMALAIGWWCWGVGVIRTTVEYQP
jgi:hypothetical protein